MKRITLSPFIQRKICDAIAETIECTFPRNSRCEQYYCFGTFLTIRKIGNKTNVIPKGVLWVKPENHYYDWEVYIDKYKIQKLYVTDSNDNVFVVDIPF